MKNVLIVILLAVSVALGAVFAHQRNQLAQLRAQLAGTESALAAVQARLKEKSEAIENATLAESRAKLLQKTLTERSAAATEQSKQVEKLEQSLADAKTNTPANPLAGMFKDPKMRDMIKSQQKAFMGPMIDKTYATLFQQLNLTPEQAAYVKDLIQKKMLANADSGMSMVADDLTADQRTELAKQIKESNDAFNAQLKEYLGDDNYQAYESYEKSLSDRMSVGQYRDQIAGTDAALSPAQEQQLIQAMSDERSSFQWTADYSNPNPADANFAEMFNEDRLSRFAEERARYDEQVLAKAKTILNAGQLKSFEEHLATQRRMQEISMKMAAQMFGKKPDGK
jgi:hypothetical protein